MSLNKILESEKNIDNKWKEGLNLYKKKKVLTLEFVDFGKEIANLYIDNELYQKANEVINYIKKL